MDVVSVAVRSRIMASIRSQDTAPERCVRSALHRRGYRFRKHVRTLPGSPDVVFSGLRLAVFIDGDFWHGYRLPQWSHKLSPYWLAKIERNIRRDRSTHRKLRRRNWQVLRVWEHEVRRDSDRVIQALIRVIEDRRAEFLELRSSPQLS
jgi:DNA mismatch endonuclease, patch repair protein